MASWLVPLDAGYPSWTPPFCFERS